MKTSRLAILHEQEKRVSDGLEQVKEQIETCEDKLRYGDMRSLLEHEAAQNTKEAVLPKISHVMPPVLTPCQIDINSLSEMFGSFIIQNPTQEADSESHVQPSNEEFQQTKKSVIKEASETTEESATRNNETSHPVPEDDKMSSYLPTKPLKQFVPRSSIESQFDVKYSNPSLACIGSSQAWTQTSSKRLQLVDRNGTVKDTIDTDFGVNAVFLSPQEEILLTDWSNNCIKTISRGFFTNRRTFKTLFNTKWKPNGLCFFHNGDIAVTFFVKRAVLIYSKYGYIIKELDKSLFRHPFRVAQSKINSNLYISDKKDTTADSTGKVLALDKDYKVRFEYTGPDDRGFYPWGICTDNAGRVLITDINNNRVHILDEDGKFLQYLIIEEPGLKWPVSIDVDSVGNLWVGEWEGGVKVVV